MQYILSEEEIEDIEKEKDRIKSLINKICMIASENCIYDSSGFMRGGRCDYCKMNEYCLLDKEFSK